MPTSTSKSDGGRDGRLQLVDDTLIFESPDAEGWRLAIADLAVLGEFTNADGPELPDYFFIFVKNDGAWHRCAIYADGALDVSGRICKLLGCEEPPSLADRTDLASVAQWPPVLSGRELFRFEEISTSWWRRWLLGPEYTIHLSAAVADYLRDQNTVSE